MTEITAMDDGELMAAVASALLDADDAAFEAAAARIRGMFRDICTVYSGGMPNVADDGLLLSFPPFPARPAPRLIDGCPGMTRLADDAHGGAL